MTREQEMRVFGGLLAQPLVAAVAAFVLFPALEYIAEAAGASGGRALDPLRAAVSVAFGAAIASVFVVVFGALPAIAWVASRRPLTLGISLAAGAVLGNMPAAIIFLLASLNHAWANGNAPGPLALLRPIAFGSSVGTVCGAAFWAIAGAKRTSSAHHGLAP